MGFANLCRIGENKASKSELIGKTFRGIGLHAMPFEPQKFNSAPRRFQQVEPSLSDISRVLCTPSMQATKRRSMRRYRNIPVECLEATIADLNFSKAKKLPVQKNILGTVLKENGKYYLVDATGRLFILAVQLKANKDLLESSIGKRIQASRGYTTSRSVGYELVPIED